MIHIHQKATHLEIDVSQFLFFNTIEISVLDQYALERRMREIDFVDNASWIAEERSPWLRWILMIIDDADTPAATINSRWLVLIGTAIITLSNVSCVFVSDVNATVSTTDKHDHDAMLALCSSKHHPAYYCVTWQNISWFVVNEGRYIMGCG